MQVSKLVMEPLLHSHLDQTVDGSTWTFTFMPSSSTHWTNEVFSYVIGALQANPEYKETIVSEKLYVTPAESENSLVIEGMSHISLYCLNESPSVVPHSVINNHVKISKILPDEFPVVITSRVHTQSTSEKIDYTTWESLYKHYKIVKEFHYTHNDTTFKVLITRQSEDANSMYMKSSGVSSAPMMYEFEMTVQLKTDGSSGSDNGSGKDPNADIKANVTVNSIMANCMTMVQLLMQQKYPLSRKQQFAIAEEYNNLVKPFIEVPRWQKYETKKSDEATGGAASATGMGGVGGAIVEDVDADADGEADANAKQISSFNFLAPKPITLEQMHLVEPGPDTYGIQSIMKGYAVTDKADGERMLLYINKTGHAYLINNTFDVMFTGLVTQRPELFASVLDGEFISGNKRIYHHTSDADAASAAADKLDIFAVFDIYFQNGKKTTDLPLITLNADTTARTRYNLMLETCNTSYWKGSKAFKPQIELICKAHIPGDGKSILDSCKQLLYGAGNLPYKIDGLIFTPRDLAVFGYYPGIPVPLPENPKWERVMKWKPAEQNTIDFLIKEIPNSMRVDHITRKTYKKFKLYTGYNASQWEPITPMEGVRLRYDKQYAYSAKKLSRVYLAKEFKPFSNTAPGVEIAELEVIDAKGTCVCIEDKSHVISDTIVEFAFDKDTPTSPSLPNISRRWIPLRVREDKTRIYQRKKTLSKTANDLSVATSIWRAIHNPVTRGHITGITPMPTSSVPGSLEERILGVDDVYYARDVPRNHLLSVHMLDFHNQGIKKMLYSKSQHRDSLIEFACGMAGDLPRWRDGCYRFVMGVDLSRDNIVNPRDGAYARMLKQKYALSAANVKNCSDGIEGRPVYMDTVFVVGDCAKPLHNANAAGDDTESVKLLKILYNKPTRGIEPYLSKLIGRASRGFSMASCMFAIHYFFYNEEKLDGFLNNVSNSLKQGGIFITTYMDGQSVDKLLHETPETIKRGFVEGRKLNEQVPVWSIVKRYDTFTKDDSYGKHVDVFLENTNKLIPEFLVYFDVLIEKAAAHGLVCVEDGMFSDTFNQVIARATKKHTKDYDHLESAVMHMKEDSVQTQFSFLNRWTVFKKA